MMKLILALRLWYWEIKALQYQMARNDAGFEAALVYKAQAHMDLFRSGILK